MTYLELFPTYLDVRQPRILAICPNPDPPKLSFLITVFGALTRLVPEESGDSRVVASPVIHTGAEQVVQIVWPMGIDEVNMAARF